MKSSNIFIFAPSLYPCEIGGMEIFNYYFAESLSKLYDISILTNCDQNKIGKVEYIYINKNKFLLFFYIDILTKLLIHKNYDLLVFPYTSNSPLIYPFLLINMVFKINYIIVIHGGGMYPWSHVFFQRKFFMEASDIIAVSKPIKFEYEKRTGKSIKFIPPLIPYEIAKEFRENLRRKYNLKDVDVIFISVGSIKKIKGCSILLEAFIELGEEYIKNNHLKLIYVGEGPLRLELEKKVRENNLENFIIFMGSVPHENVNELYKIADVYVIPSLFEGTPLSLLEAMFNSLRIIGSDVSGINNIIKHGNNGLLFKPEDYLDLKNKMEYIIQNIKQSTILGKNAKKSYLTNYSYENMINQYNKIISKIKE